MFIEIKGDLYNLELVSKITKHDPCKDKDGSISCWCVNIYMPLGLNHTFYFGTEREGLLLCRKIGSFLTRMRKMFRESIE